MLKAPLVVALLLLCTTGASAAPFEIRNGVVLMPNDETISPFNRPFNLAGKSVTFTRTSAETFSAQTGPLQFEEDLGTMLTLDRTSRSAIYTISGFDFPFAGTPVRKLYLSQLLAIYLDVPSPPPSYEVDQWGEAELLAEGKPVIAPLLTTTRGQGNYLTPNLFVRETADRVVVTWFEATRPLAIQAVLFANGDIRFSYRAIGNTRGGALLITTGAEASRTGETIVAASDAANDVKTSAGAVVDAMLDVTQIAIERVGRTNVLQATIKTRAPIDQSKLTTGFITARLHFGTAAAIEVLIERSGRISTNMPHWRLRAAAPSARIEGDTLKIAFAQERLFGGFDGNVHLTMTSSGGGDEVTFAASIFPPPRPASIDFATTAPAAGLTGPIVDAFVLPEFSYVNAGLRAQELLRYDPAEIDAVVFYQTYANTYGVPTASVGNPGADHISFLPQVSTAKPREPNLVEMGEVGYLWNADDVFGIQVLMHEFGHRWLFDVGATGSDGKTIELQQGLHPRTELDTRAAFAVRGPEDCSVMGGVTYVERTDGTFILGGGDEGCGNGYSWMDLYLMGLAAPEEVPPFFYISDYPEGIFESLENAPFHARKNEVTIQQVTARMGGPRVPAYPNTQSTFRAIFVLVYDPAQPATDAQVESVARFASLLRETFPIATGGRGKVETDFTPPPLPRKRRAL